MIPIPQPATSSQPYTRLSLEQVAAIVAERMRSVVTYDPATRRFAMRAGDGWAVGAMANSQAESRMLDELAQLGRERRASVAAGSQRDRSFAAREVLSLESCATFLAVRNRLKASLKKVTP